MQLTSIAGHRYAVREGWHVDDAREIIQELPEAAWARYDSPFEAKFTLADKGKIDDYEALCDLFAILEGETILESEDLFGVNLIPDMDRHYAGVFRYATGDHLGVHVDAGIHPTSGLRKHVTAVLYFGGDGPLELWAGRNCVDAGTGIATNIQSILPASGRLVLFENNDYAWHGTPVNTGTEDRIVVTVSYLSDAVDAFANKRQRAYFVPRPDEAWTPETYALRDLRSDPVRFAEAWRA